MKMGTRVLDYRLAKASPTIFFFETKTRSEKSIKFCS